MQRSVFGIGIGTIIIASSGCGGDLPATGALALCYATDDDADLDLEVDGPALHDETRTGLNLVAAGDSIAAPAAFSACVDTAGVVDGEGLMVQELVDGDGAHVWIGLRASIGDTMLPTDDVFADFADGELAVRNSFDGQVSSARLVLRDVQLLRFAGQSNAVLDGDVGTLQVSDDGGDGLPGNTGCGSVTAQRLRFAGSSDDVVLNNGERRYLTADNFLEIANLFSASYGASSCPDDERVGTLVSWSAIRSTAEVE
ncbi:MAG TPA: hypothetical protein VGF99_21835 [Myxococcota bacterium]